MRKRVNEITANAGSDVRVSTFHSFCTYLLSSEAKNFGIDSNFLIYDMSEQVNVVKECIKEMNLDDKKFKPSWVANRISRAKDDLEHRRIAGRLSVQRRFLRTDCRLDIRMYQKKQQIYNAFDCR
jgi:DNA helicase-2/ATP-dependent DNA helicase PcrA